MQADLPSNESPTADRAPKDGDSPGVGDASAPGAVTDDTRATDGNRRANDKFGTDDGARRGRPRGGRSAIARVLWTGHWVLRIWLAGYLLIYGWSKVFLTQMGRADFADALVQFGEMSPMGLLWRFMAFSPMVQVIAGLAEVTAAVLLLFRRTAWLGAALAAVDMTIVFLLNLTFDVPVKQLSGIMAIAGLILLVPNMRRLGHFLLGKTAGPASAGHISRNRIFVAITRWTSPLLAAAMIVGSGIVFGNMSDWGRLEQPSVLAGVYDVSRDGKTLFHESSLTQVAFSQVTRGNKARVSLRYADGEFQDGTYTVDGTGDGTGTNGGEVTLKLFPVQHGAQGLDRDYSTESTLQFQVVQPGRIHLTGDGVDATLISDSERRFLFDRNFSWEPRTPVNR